jgi:hypothetical protein
MHLGGQVPCCPYGGLAEASVPLNSVGPVLKPGAGLSLCLASGVSHGDAAALLALPLGTVKAHVARGRATLLSILGERP